MTTRNSKRVTNTDSYLSLLVFPANCKEYIICVELKFYFFPTSYNAPCLHTSTNQNNDILCSFI